MKIKVLYLLSTVERSGSTNVVYNIVKYLDKDKITPIVVTLSPEPATTRKSEFENLGAKVHTFSKSRVFWMLSSMHSFKELIDAIGPDIIHSHTLRADVSSAKHLSNYSRMSTVHSDMTANYTDTYGAIIGKIFAKRQVESIGKLEKAVACSKAVYDLYKAEINDLTCIQNGIDQEYFYPVYDKAELRKQLGLPADKIIFISVGSLIRRKNPETVIQGFLLAKNSKSSLVILGGGALEDELKRKYGMHQNIIFKGFTPNVTPYLQASDFFISASSSEGLPNTVMEALGCGLPVCLSDIPPHKEILSIDPNVGKLFSSGSPQQLSDAMNVLSKGAYAALQKSAINIVAHQLNARKMAQQYEELYLGHKKW